MRLARLFQRLSAWVERTGLLGHLAIALTIAASVCGVATYAALTGAGPFGPSPRIVLVLLNLDLVLLLALGALGLLLSVHVKQLENFAGTMNFVIFPMYFMSTALYPLWKLEESGAVWVYQIARWNPFTYAVEWMRFALYGKDPGIAPWVVLGTLAVYFALASWGYDPQRGFGALTKRPGGAA